MQLGRELEKDACGNQRSFWARVSGNKKAGDCRAQICGRDGRILVDEEEVREWWKEHFELYGQVSASQHTLCSEVPVDGELEIMQEEVRRGVRRLKVRKAAGICGIMPEMLRAGGEMVVQWLTGLFNMVWRVGRAPGDWKNAVIVPIHKKGSRMECTNYRGIGLTSIVGKVQEF